MITSILMRGDDTYDSEGTGRIMQVDWGNESTQGILWEDRDYEWKETGGI